jgi:hypothetical protein
MFQFQIIDHRIKDFPRPMWKMLKPKLQKNFKRKALWPFPSQIVKVVKKGKDPQIQKD